MFTKNNFSAGMIPAITDERTFKIVENSIKGKLVGPNASTSMDHSELARYWNGDYWVASLARLAKTSCCFRIAAS